MKVPFLDLDRQYQAIKSEIHSAIEEVINTKKFIQGDFVKQFEHNFCEVHGGSHAVGCSNGTSAITVALRGLGVERDDEIITTSNTFFATVEAIHEVGSKIVLVDSRPDTYGMDLEKLEQKIGEKTKVIIPVHLYGNPVEMDRLMAIAAKYNLKVLEDCAQAHLATFNNQAVATFGSAGTFSFFPGKNLGAYGDAGLVILNNEDLRNKVEMHVNHGRISKYEHDFLAGNFRMDGMQAAILNVKLKYLNAWTNQRIEVAHKYDSLFKAKGFKVIEKHQSAKCVYHLYVVEVSNRQEVMDHLKKHEIETGIHYPVPMHLQPALKFLGHKKGEFPVCENSANRVLSIPIFPEMTNEQIDYVTEKFFEVAKK